MDDFEIQLKNWRDVRLTEAEKASMLKEVFSRPVPSPYARYARAFAYIRKPAGLTLIAFFAFSSSVAYASQRALPGETLYAVKVKMVEPVVTALTFKAEKKLEWEAKKVERRIGEAEALAKEHKLDDEKAKDIERKIEKSSGTFGAVAEEVSKKAATSTKKQREKEEELKQEFKQKLESHESDSKDKHGEDHEKIERLKERAVEALERKGKKGQTGG